MSRSSGWQKRGTSGALVALVLALLLGACASDASPELAADEQSAAAARDKLASDEQSGNAAMIADDTHAVFLAQQKLLHDRGELTQEERRIEGGSGGHGGGGHM